MRGRVEVILSAVLAVVALGSIGLVAHAADASSERKAPTARAARQFVGYWMGIDPLDGGDSRRGITKNADRTFSIVGRDSLFTLCDDTDRAIITVSDGVVVGSALTSDNLVITRHHLLQRWIDRAPEGALRSDRQEHHPRDGNDPGGRVRRPDHLPPGKRVSEAREVRATEVIGERR